MIVRLSDTIFTADAHLIWGKPDEVIPKITDPVLPIPEPYKFQWPSDMPKCNGLDRISFNLNGLDREAWICGPAIDNFKIKMGTYGSAYENVVRQCWSTIEQEPEPNLFSGQVYCGNSAVVYEELVMEWGYGNKLINSITTSTFVKLVCAGRGKDHHGWAGHCAVLLTMMGITPTEYPLEKALESFASTKAITSLLKLVANEKRKTEHEQRKHYSEISWNLRTKSTCTTS